MTKFFIILGILFTIIIAVAVATANIILAATEDTGSKAVDFVIRTVAFLQAAASIVAAVYVIITQVF